MFPMPDKRERLSAFQTQQRQLDFASVKRACPKGIYLAPTPKDPNSWQGVLFVRKGPYAPAILKFRILFSVPGRPPIIAVSTDIFHPLVTPLTTYTYTTNDSGADTVSASDEDRLPPGGFSLRAGFPEWFGPEKQSSGAADVQPASALAESSGTQHPTETEEAGAGGRKSSVTPSPAPASPALSPSPSPSPSPIPSSSPSPSLTTAGAASDTTDQSRFGAVEIARVLYYVRSAFDSEDVLDKVPIEAAGNPGAWHAWKAHRAKVLGGTASNLRPGSGQTEGTSSSVPARQQPGGARRPGQWNWEGVWEERVKKGINASISQSALYSSGQDSDLINFLDIEPELLERAAAIWKHSTEQAPEQIPA